MANVVREDVVQISFQVADNPLSKLTAEMDKLKSSVAGAVMTAEKKFGAMNDAANVAQGGVDGIKKSLDGVGAAGRAVDKIKNGINTINAAEAAQGVSELTAKAKELAKTKFNNIKSGLTDGKAGAEGLYNALKKVAAVSLSGLHSGLSKIGPLARSAGKALLSGLGKAAVTAVKGATATMATGAIAFSALTAKSLSAAGELEQNIGGAESVFGALGGSIGAMTAPVQIYNSALEAVEVSTASLENVSKNAYANMGLSQSDYLATVNKMGALFKGSGFEQQEALNLSAQAMQRAADVASIMGIDVGDAMESIAGAAKGNFTMMDNLGVAINDTTLKAYAQEKGLGELKTTQDKVGAAMAMFMERTADYAGNYAKENQTLAGSLQTAKAAMTNFLSGAGDAEQVISAVGGAVEVVAKRLPGIAASLGSGIQKIVGGLLPKIGPILQSVFPQIIASAVELANGLSAQLPGIISTAMPSVLMGITQIIGGILNVLSTSGPQIASAIVGGLNAAATSVLGMLPQFVTAAGQIIIALVQGIAQSAPTLIPAIVQSIRGMINALMQMLPQFIVAGAQLLLGLARGVVQAIPQLIAAIPQVIRGFINTVLSNLPTIIQLGVQLLVMLAVGLIQAIPQLVAAIPQIIRALWDGLTSVNWLDLGVEIIKGIGGGIINGVKSLFGGGKKAGKGAAEGVGSGISAGTAQVQASAAGLAASVAPSFAPIVNTAQYGTAAASNLASGIASGAGTAIAAASDMAANVQTAGSADVTVNLSVEQSGLAAASETVNGFVAETQTAMERIPPAFDTAMGTAAQTVTAKMTEMNSAVTNGMNACLAAVKNGLSQISAAVAAVNLSAAGANMMNGLVNGINSRKAAAVAAARSVANAVNAEFNKIQKIHSPSKVWEEKGKFLIQGGIIGMEKQMPKMRATAREAGEVAVPYLGNYTPENGGGAYYSRSSSEEYNSYAPVFNLTINGGSEDDRSLARKVKRFVKEGIEDTFESLSRKQPKPRRA